MTSVSAELVKIGLELRRHQKIVLAASFLAFFIPSFVLLASFLGLRPSNTLSVVVFSLLLGILPLLAAEAAMLLPIKALQDNLEKNPSQLIDAPCSLEKAMARVLRVFSERGIAAHDLKSFASSREGLVLRLIGVSEVASAETLFCFQPLFAVSLKPKPYGNTVAVVYHEGDSAGHTLAEVVKTKLKVG